ncbi:hypothetical protein GS636_16125 [Ruegeria sp. HKCCD4884]|uniref:hypothetical protein n=1 Tax=Ruegeria sp. HKCCD4884 TaxID=2683022 RepID=UPI0014914C0B|nr:hypothetical protein [Ruegeria sp. HKCCD4884]NOD94318.1 hypothetical protein [Ruegeria sp. HKCCD4884]
MRYKAIGMTVLCAALLYTASCSGMSYAMKTYGDVDPINFEAYGRTWRVFDKPESGLIMLTPSLGDAALAGAAEGATFGLAGSMDPTQLVFQSAAAEYLKSTGRTCDIRSARLVIDPQWEFTYTC